MNTLPAPHPLLVVILDGWGISFVKHGNAILAADTPVMDTFAHQYPTAAISAAGMEVGLPWGEVGNSEVGHTNIGAGQVRYQMLPTVDKAIEDGSFFSNSVLTDAIQHVKNNKSQLHILGVVSTGGVHGHINHIIATLELAARNRLRDNVYLHLFTDGRDSPPQSALSYIQTIERAIGKLGAGQIASVMGRLYAMDRNENWDRTEQAYNLLTGGPRVAGAPSISQAVQQSYSQNIYDEMMLPTAITRGGGPVAAIRDNDAVIFTNFRPDRARQLTRAFTDPQFTGFARRTINNLYFCTMAQYDATIPAPAAFTEKPVDQPLARIISDAGLRQLHIAETEKYAHITYYLNGGHEEPFPGEEHMLIPSATVKNFAEKPRMSAQEITDKTIQELARKEYDVYFINYANADMVGHSGNFDATVTACSFVDTCLGRLYQAALSAGGAMLITADHGNAEEKIHPHTGMAETDHSNNPVPLHYVRQELYRTVPRSDDELMAIYSSPIGVLADIAPTILDILYLPKPEAMTGVSLLDSLQ